MMNLNALVIVKQIEQLARERLLSMADAAVAAVEEQTIAQGAVAAATGEVVYL